MATEAFERHALSGALRDQIDGRKVLSALFTTYTFDRGFFELHVLPLLFSRAFSKHDRVRLAELEEELTATDVAVYFDRGAVLPGNGGGVLGVHTFGVRRATAAGETKGCFHPKLCLALVQAEDGAEALVVGVFSANLTEAGHWSNVECAWLDEIAAGARSSYGVDLVEILKSLGDEVRVFGTEQTVLKRLQRFLRNVKPTRTRDQDGRYLPRLFYGQDSLVNFLRDELDLSDGEFHLEILSPFFDDGPALARLCADLQPKKVRVYLPTDDAGAATCTNEYFEKVTELNVEWARFIESTSRGRGASQDDDQRRRPVHAKVYRLWSRDSQELREYLVLGSPNLTEQAHSHKRAGNFEVAVVFESRDPLPRWFLAPIDAAPIEFAATSPLIDELPQQAAVVCRLLLRFHWAARRCEAYWDDHEPSPRITLRMRGALLHPELEGLPPRVWIEQPNLAEQLADHLTQTSLVQVHAAGAEAGWLIVQEEDLAQKTSAARLALTVEDILRYWTALSAAQRQALLERAEERRVRGLNGLPPLPAVHGMFDRFAGVFHAFERLRESVESAVTQNRTKEAEYRLFGAKHDSLPTLLEQLANDEGSEAVEAPAEGGTGSDSTTRLAVRYATLLSAQRLLRQLEESVPGFITEHAGHVRKLREQLAAPKLRQQIVDGVGANGLAFVDWFDEWFLAKGRRGAA